MLKKTILALALLAGCLHQAAFAAAEGASPAKLWGLMYHTSTPTFEETYWGWLPPGEYVQFYDWQLRVDRNYRITSYKAEFDTSGDGEFQWLGHRDGDGRYNSNLGVNQYVGRERFAYTVPDDQVLLINEVSGDTWINGMPVSGTKRPVYYLFAAGEVVLLVLNNNALLTGFTGDPAFFSGGGARGGKTQVK